MGVPVRKEPAAQRGEGILYRPSLLQTTFAVVLLKNLQPLGLVTLSELPLGPLLGVPTCPPPPSPPTHTEGCYLLTNPKRKTIISTLPSIRKNVFFSGFLKQIVEGCWAIFVNWR